MGSAGFGGRDWSGNGSEGRRGSGGGFLRREGLGWRGRGGGRFGGIWRVCPLCL